MRIEAREVDLEEKEEKVRTDVDWVARSDEDLKRREKAVEEAGRSASQVQASAEHATKEAEQRFLEIESRERALREEAAHEAIELSKRTEALKQFETELSSKQAEFEKARRACGNPSRQRSPSCMRSGSGSNGIRRPSRRLSGPRRRRCRSENGRSLRARRSSKPKSKSSRPADESSSQKNAKPKLT